MTDKCTKHDFVLGYTMKYSDKFEANYYCRECPAKKTLKDDQAVKATKKTRLSNMGGETIKQFERKGQI